MPVAALLISRPRHRESGNFPCPPFPLEQRIFQVRRETICASHHGGILAAGISSSPRYRSLSVAEAVEAAIPSQTLAAPPLRRVRARWHASTWIRSPVRSRSLL